MMAQNVAFCHSYGYLDVSQGHFKSGCEESQLHVCKHRSTPNLLTTSQSQMERIKIISEFCEGEEALVSDLKIVVKVYKHPLEKLGILSSTEINQLFYSIEAVIPVFETLANNISSEFNKYFGMPCIGTVLYLWLGLEVVAKPLPDYLDYGLNRYPYSASKYVQSICGNYVKKMPSSIKLLLDYSAHLYEARKHFEALREQKPSFTDFLSRCSHANFSKRLDLWHFLECPKTRLIRYPLLLDRLIKLTPSTDPELSHLLVVRSTLTCIVEELNRRIGEAMRNLYMKYIEFSVNLEYKNMVWHQKSLLLKGDLLTGIGEVTAFVFPQLMVITTSTRPDNTVRPISRFCNGRLSRRNAKLRVNTSPGKVSTSNEAPSPNVSSPRSEIYSHQWSLPSVFKTHSPIDLDNATPRNRLSKCSRLFRRLSSFMTSSAKSEVSPFKATTSFTPADATTIVEKYHVCFPPLILKEYILEDVTNDNVPLGVLKFPFSLEKTHQNLFRLFPCEDYLKRKSARRVKQSDLLHSYKKVMSKSPHEIKCFSSSSLSYSNLFLRKSPKTISRDFLFQASSSGDKKFWITTLIPLVHSYNQSKSHNNLVLI